MMNAQKLADAIEARATNVNAPAFGDDIIEENWKLIVAALRSSPSLSGESVDETLLRKVIDETWGEALEDGSVPSTKLQDKILAAVRAKAPLSQETK